MRLPAEFEAGAFRTSQGEFAWPPAEIPRVVAALRRERRAILGGELWLVRGADIWPAITDPAGAVAVHTWDPGERAAGESWDAFVDRCAEATLSAAAAIGASADLAAAAGPRTPYCNIEWVSEAEYAQLRDPAA